MNKTSQNKTAEQTVEAIFALDLNPIKFKLMDKEEGHGWTPAEADRYELEYKQFLALLAKFPGEVIVPTKSVDKFWHGHILDTMKYAEDCHKVFGYFLHHFPYFGMRGEDDAANLVKAAVNTQRLYKQEFGDVMEKSASYCYAPTAEKSASYCYAPTAEKNASYCYAPTADASVYAAADNKVITKLDRVAA